MGITCDRGRWYWVKRVPARFRGVVRGADGRAVGQVRQALHTDSRAEALRKAARVEAERLAQWEALLAGETGAARRHIIGVDDTMARIKARDARDEVVVWLRDHPAQPRGGPQNSPAQTTTPGRVRRLHSGPGVASVT